MHPTFIATSHTNVCNCFSRQRPTLHRDTMIQGGSDQIETKQWHESSDECFHCGDASFSVEYGPNQLLLCEACTLGACHVKCYKERTGIELDQDLLEKGGVNWFCSEVREVGRCLSTMHIVSRLRSCSLTRASACSTVACHPLRCTFPPET